MDNQKEEAIANYVEQRKEEAKKIFQGNVNSILSEISRLSRELKAAKKRFLELKYEEPESLEI